MKTNLTNNNHDFNAWVVCSSIQAIASVNAIPRYWHLVSQGLNASWLNRVAMIASMRRVCVHWTHCWPNGPIERELNVCPNACLHCFLIIDSGFSCGHWGRSAPPFKWADTLDTLDIPDTFPHSYSLSEPLVIINLDKVTSQAEPLG